MMMMEINEENRFEWIDKYLENELTEDELSFFYNALENDESLQTDLQAQREIHEQLLDLARLKAYANGQQTLIENENMYSKDEYAHFKLIQGILKEKEREDEPDLDAQEPNFFKKNFRILMAAAAIIVIGLVVWWTIPDTNIKTDTGNSTVQTDTTNKESEEKGEVLNQNGENIEEVIAEENPTTEKIQEDKPQIVEEDTNPKQFQIPEYTISSRLGFAGQGQPNAKKRLILIYPKSPSTDIKDLSKAHYLFDDTLRFYGKNIKSDELQLIYAQNDQEYYLVQKTDTLEIAKHPIWKPLKK